MPSYFVTILAKESPAELESLCAKLEAEYTRIGVELDLAKQALALQARQRRSPHSTATAPTQNRRGKPSNTRQRIHDIFAAAPEPVGQAHVKKEMAKQDEPSPKGGSIYSMMARMTEEGELTKVSHGLYMLTDRLGTDAIDHGPTENGAGARPSTALLAPQEG